MAKNTSKSKTLPIYILNGPNLNLLGHARAGDLWPHHPGPDRKDVRRAGRPAMACHRSSAKSNKEGEMVEFLQEARTAAARRDPQCRRLYPHLGRASWTRIQTLKHAGDRSASLQSIPREDFRHHSYVAKAATGSIMGLGVNGYLLAVDAVAALLAASKMRKRNEHQDDIKSRLPATSRASTPRRSANCPSFWRRPA